MSELRLGRNDSYTPEQFGLGTPLLFSRSALTLSYNGIESPITHVQADLAQQVIEQQVSQGRYDRATIPVWMVQGELDQGFFRGVLRPRRRRSNAAMIAFSEKLPEFMFYMEHDGFPELGSDVKPELTIFQRELRALTMRGDSRLSPEEITPNFEVTLDPAYPSLVIFKVD
jgi:hypothetical protein